MKSDKNSESAATANQPVDGTKCGTVGQPNGKLILASSSPRRKDLLQALGLQFEIIPSTVEEIVDATISPELVVASLAKQKAQEVFDRLTASEPDQPMLVLGADTIVVLHERFLGKPVDKNDACAMLTQLSGQKHEVFTGVCLVTALNGKKKTWESVERSAVHFRPLGQIEIKAYVETGEPMDKAGAYALQEIGACLVERIEGSHTNIVGLPIPNVVSLLRQAGYGILGVTHS
jgi:septum formation protein